MNVWRQNVLYALFMVVNEQRIGMFDVIHTKEMVVCEQKLEKIPQQFSVYIEMCRCGIKIVTCVKAVKKTLYLHWNKEFSHRIAYIHNVSSRTEFYLLNASLNICRSRSVYEEMPSLFVSQIFSHNRNLGFQANCFFNVRIKMALKFWGNWYIIKHSPFTVS